MSRVLGIVVVVGILGSALGGPVEAQISNREFAQRRADLAAEIGNGLILAMGSAQPPEDYMNFYQNSPFRYLTGFVEPNAAFLALVSDGVITRDLLFVNPRNPAEETWEGYRVGPGGTDASVGIEGRSVSELPAVFDSLVSSGWETVFIVSAYDLVAAVRNDVTQRVDALVEAQPKVDFRMSSDVVDQLRGVKTPAELDLIRRAVMITSQAHREFMGAVAPGINEFEIQALVEHAFRRYGSERPSFASIIGSGHNSTVLHYNANDRFMEAGDLVVVDIGASYQGYAADVTRTVPVNGRFTEEQRQVYQLVRDAQTAAEVLARPGVSSSEMSQAAAEVLARGLAELGLTQSAGATFEDEYGREIPQYYLYYMHALSHGLGIDVHDPWPSVVESGVAFTIEPGIYVRPNLFTEVVPDTPANRSLRDEVMSTFERYAGIGVRIEDDYLITADGVERISLAPREVDEIEVLMSGSREGPQDRNREWVEWYRGMR